MDEQDEFKRLTRLNDKSIKKIRDLEFGKERRDKEIKTLKETLKELEKQNDEKEELYDNLWDEADEIMGGRTRAEERLEELIVSKYDDKLNTYFDNYYKEDDDRRFYDTLKSHEERNLYSMMLDEGSSIKDMTDRLYTSVYGRGAKRDEDEEVEKEVKIVKKYYSPITKKNITKKSIKQLTEKYALNKTDKARESLLKSFNDQRGEGLGEKILDDMGLRI